MLGITQQAAGRSPRVRRNPAVATAALAGSGSISARAEEPLRELARADRHRVDLRACGGTTAAVCESAVSAGRSPRVRRNRARCVAPALLGGSISARAEEPCGYTPTLNLQWVDLRACGGTTTRRSSLPRPRGRSPRVRRNRVLMSSAMLLIGSISARAEEPRQSRVPGAWARVDLRACGGTTSAADQDASITGRSPRVRRNLLASRAHGFERGSISARAEEPAKRRLDRQGYGVDVRA